MNSFDTIELLLVTVASEDRVYANLEHCAREIDRKTEQTFIDLDIC